MTNQTNNFPGLHPSPPEDLKHRQLPLIEFTAETIFYRVHQAKYSPVYYGNSGRGRFDTPEGVIYLALDEYVAFRETIGRFSKYSLISNDELSKRRITEIKISRNLSLVDLTGSGLTLLDADARLLTSNYQIAQQWSQAIQNHPSHPDGIYYRSRHDPSRFCIALYQASTSSILQINNTYDFLDEEYQITLSRILDKYNYGLV